MEAETDLSPLGELRVDITPHKRAPGAPRPFRRRFAAPEGLGLPSVEVEVDDFITDLNLEFVGSQLVVSGTITANWHGPCRRCLAPVREELPIEVREIFELDAVDGETYEREEDFADLSTMVTEAIMLALPLAPLCGPECSGPEPDRYHTSVVSDGDSDNVDDAESAPKDPRWAALDDVTFG